MAHTSTEKIYLTRFWKKSLLSKNIICLNLYLMNLNSKMLVGNGKCFVENISCKKLKNSIQ